MEKLLFDHEVFDAGAGKIYQMLINIAMPAMVFGVLEIALINSGLLKTEGIPPIALKLIGVLTIVYIIPSIFAFPTAWFLSYGKIRLYKSGSIDLYKKKIVYHQVVSITMATPKIIDWSVTQLRRVEKKRGYYVLHGTVTNETSGGSGSQLKIPAVFEDMHLISERARYH